MTPEAQRAAIMEACGWYLITDDDDGSADMWSLREPKATTLYPWHQCRDDCWRDGPDYLEDLDAMHEAEKVLTEYGDRYWEVLHEIVNDGRWFEPRDASTQDARKAACATAAQRAEAFLKTVGKWEDSK